MPPVPCPAVSPVPGFVSPVACFASSVAGFASPGPGLTSSGPGFTPPCPSGLPAPDALDMNPVGHETNRRNLEVAIDCVYRQGMIPKRFEVEELFA